MTETGFFAVNTQTRRAVGYLLPWGVKSKGVSSSGTKPITFPRGNVALPRDPMVISLNDEHERFQVIGRADQLEDREQGVYAEFAIANTDEGDAWLAEHADGAYFSAEIDGLRRAPDDTGTGRLAGAAVTIDPAFDGTGVALFSLIGDETLTEAHSEPETTDPAPAEPAEEPDEEPAEEQEDAVAEATVPGTMLASRRPQTTAPGLTKAGFFSALRRYHATKDREVLRPYAQAAAEVGLFALADITYDDAVGLATVAGIPNTWLGELWQGRKFARKVIPLLSSGTLTSPKAKGWHWGTKPTMAPWLGNKNPVPSTAPTVEPAEFDSARFAGGNDLAREYYDFGVTEVTDSYIEAMVDSYARLSDAYALTELEDAATAFVPGAATENVALAGIVYGALAVIAAEATPSFSVVGTDVFRNLLLTPHDQALEYLNMALGLESGESSGFVVVPDARLAVNKVIVGAKEAATAWELPGSPIRVSIDDVVKGGKDEALFGYISVGVEYPAAVVEASLVLPAAAAASKK